MAAAEPRQSTAALRNFDPSDDDLVGYLERKLAGEPHPCPPTLLPEIDVYGDQKPWEMFDKNADRFYAFARLKKRGGRRFHRSAGGGTWNLKISKAIRNRFWKRYFIYDIKPKEGLPIDDKKFNTQWSMREFSLMEAVHNDFVICKIYNKAQAQKQRRRKRTAGTLFGRSNVVNFLPAGDSKEMVVSIPTAEGEDEDEDEVSVWESGMETDEEEEEVGMAAAADTELGTKFSTAIRAEENLEEFDLESKGEIQALTDNFWREQPGNIWQILSWNDAVLGL